jgi:hypothetical protein
MGKRNPMLWRVDSDLFKNNWLSCRPSSLCIFFGIGIEDSNPTFSASDFFQYFNPSNTCLQVLDLIEFFLLKLPPILKKVTL